MSSQFKTTPGSEPQHLDNHNAVVIAQSLVNQVKKSDTDQMVQHQREM